MPIQNTIFVFIPDSLEKTNVGFLSGFVVNKPNTSEFYITKDKLNIESTNCIGYCGMSQNATKKNWIHINYYDETLKVNEVSCDNTGAYNLIFLVYDYFTFCNSEIVHITSTNYGEHFKNLSQALKRNSDTHAANCGLVSYVTIKILSFLLMLTNFMLVFLKFILPIGEVSSTISLINNTFSTMQWALKSLIDERKVNLKVGNLVISKFVDVVIGSLILYWLFEYEIDLSRILNDTAKDLITHLQQLLKFLMGSPVGLKLNHAFNNALGNFFLYHIALWKTFLIVTSPYMETAFMLVYVLATLGFSFQAALAADILTFATFHVYCIYVYAARLYGVQVHGLISLWRLFIGRKRNPLRNRVDSCQYSHHQLFVGTLAFTILLFLLPTTMLYYVVFTTLRLTLTAFDNTLRWIRHKALSLPLYVTWLWALNSPRTRGTVYFQMNEQIKDSGALTLSATLRTDPWWHCVEATRPPYRESPFQQSVSYSTLVHSIAIGDLL